jgi:N-acetylglucosamine-6-phosphate deacetylase
LLTNARLVLADHVLERGSVLIETGRIVQILSGSDDVNDVALYRQDIAGATLFPGFIDLHIHGAVGVDTMDATVAGLERLSQFLSAQGVTAWLPTLVPASLDQYARSIDAIAGLMRTQRDYWDRGRPAREDDNHESSLRDPDSLKAEQTERAGRPRSQSDGEFPGARALGVHYEGPFVSSEQCGALHREHFRTFSGAADLDCLATLSDSTAIHLMTLAPEISGAIDLIRELVKRDWIVSLGHTRARTEVLDQAARAGARHMTHFMNAMAPLHHRSPGPVGWGLMRDDVTCDLIADGIHLDRETLRLLQKLKTPERLLLISDAICAAGLGDGDYQIWGETITVAEGRTSNSSGTIAGSVITMLDAVRMMLSLGASEVEVARMAATNPARLVRIDKDCGSIEAGKRADLVALDHEHNVKLTVVSGILKVSN